MAPNKATRPRGSGTYQKSLSSDKWLESFPMIYIATEAAMHSIASIIKKIFIMIFNLVNNQNIKKNYNAMYLPKKFRLRIALMRTTA